MKIDPGDVKILRGLKKTKKFLTVKEKQEIVDRMEM